MTNFVKISGQIKKFPLQERDFDRSVYMTAICYSAPISAILTNEQFFFVEKYVCKIFDQYVINWRTHSYKEYIQSD